MTPSRPHDADQPCPFLVPVVADRLWVVPLGVYCRRPEGSIRVPARTTIATVCLTSSHHGCDGFRAAGASGSVKPDASAT